MITIYQKGHAFRVVNGPHANNSESLKGAAVRRYETTADAYTTEGNASIKDAIARIDPACLAIPVTAQHHIEPSLCPGSEGFLVWIPTPTDRLQSHRPQCAKCGLSFDVLTLPKGHEHDMTPKHRAVQSV